MTKLLKDPERSEPIFLALQGGGAKGVVHVGGLIAIDDLGLDVKGVAGTSAGSMVAALIAAGYKGQDLIDPISRTHIFQTVAPKYGFSKATDLFSPNGWRMLRAIRHVINPKKHTKSLIKKTSGLHLSLNSLYWTTTVLDRPSSNIYICNSILISWLVDVQANQWINIH
ncbi:hypothetical protein PSCICF_14000 [Pseudomonas cichorii]|nr:patatin-like phospholipase family protein [Pseudomonas cichorii]GFM55222.1 hypothetical protein PSCICF_14000 [Pseudomonas cichorii]